MNKRVSFGFGLMIAGILIFLFTANLFYIVEAIMKFVFYASSVVAFFGGINEVYEGIKNNKKRDGQPD